MPNNNHLLNTFGIAKKAGLIEYGFDAVKGSCIEGSAKAVFIANDISDSSKKSVLAIAEMSFLPCISLPFSKAEIGNALNRKPTAIIALKDDGLASSIIKKLNI